jgi:crotonobetainyl-CoA:carnitine CoA-transferase CaiB-like acyl-CoA transferase
MTANATATAQPVGPLSDIVVADFTRVLAGPLATMTLADLGARVIKVERPDRGDETRAWGPPYSATGSTYFESVNRNKESVCLDLSDPVDIARAAALITRSDVVVENFKPGMMASIGLDYVTLSAANPRLIYASISGFGSGTGRSLLGYDFTVQAVGGLMSITGPADGEAQKVGVALVDVLVAKDTIAGICAALFARERTGVGSLLELNLLSSLQGALANQGQAVLGAGVIPRRLGNAHPSIAPYETLHCADEPIVVACGTNEQFARLVEVIGAPELGSDPRFSTNAQRVRNRTQLVQALELPLGTRTAEAWHPLFAAAGVPSGIIGTIADGLELATELGLEPTIGVHNAAGDVAGTQIRHPIQWTPPLARHNSAPPGLGEHTGSVLEWLDS